MELTEDLPELEIQHVVEGDDAAVEDVEDVLFQGADGVGDIELNPGLVQGDDAIVVIGGVNRGVAIAAEGGGEGLECLPIVSIVFGPLDAEFLGITQVAGPVEVDAAGAKYCIELGMRGFGGRLGGGGLRSGLFRGSCGVEEDRLGAKRGRAKYNQGRQ